MAASYPPESRAAPPSGAVRRSSRSPDQGAQLPQHGAHVPAALVEAVQLQQRRLCVPAEDILQQLCRLEVSRQAQSVQHRPAVHGAAGRRALVQKAQAVPQGAVRQTAQELRPVRRQFDALLSGHIQQPGRDVLRV